MRISNLTHETAIKNIYYAQEIEPKTFEKLTQRIGGIDMASKINKDYYMTELPYMFRSWEEYREYLLDKLVKNEYKKFFRKMFDENDKLFSDIFLQEKQFYLMCKKIEIYSILSNDWEGTKMRNFRRTPTVVRAKRKERQGSYNGI